MNIGSMVWCRICRSLERRSRAEWGSRWCMRNLAGFGNAATGQGLIRLQNDSSVELIGTFAFSDLLKFQYSQCYRYTWWLVLLFMLVSFVGLLLAIIVAVITPQHDLALRAGTWFLLLVLFWIYLVMAPYRGAKRQLKTSIPLSGEIRYVFSPQSIHSSGTHFSSDISYEALWAVRETKSLFALYSSASSALVLPKRFFKDAAQQNDWRILVEEHISPKVITRSGFLGRWL